MSPEWIPLLSSDRVVESAWKVILDVASELERFEGETAPATHYGYEDALLYCYLAAALDDKKWVDLAVERLNSAIETAAELDLSLYGGLPGLGWMIEHASKVLSNTSAPDDDPSDPGDDLLTIDTAIFRRLESESWAGRFSLIDGLVGIGVYFHERLPAPTALRGIELVLDRLEDISQPTEAGIVWSSNQEHSLSGPEGTHQCRSYDGSVAYGVPGILHFLAETLSYGIQKDRVAEMFDSATKGFLGARSAMKPKSGGGLPQKVCWCCGELAVAAVMAQIADRTGREDYRRLSNNELELLLSNPEYVSGSGDDSLCFGVIGTAHIYNRLYQVGQDMRFREMALTLLERAVVPQRHYVSSRLSLRGSSLLTGKVGLALGLLAAVSSVEPQWDRLMVMSGRNHAEVLW